MRSTEYIFLPLRSIFPFNSTFNGCANISFNTIKLTPFQPFSAPLASFVFINLFLRATQPSCGSSSCHKFCYLPCYLFSWQEGLTAVILPKNKNYRHSASLFGLLTSTTLFSSPRLRTFSYSWRTKMFLPFPHLFFLLHNTAGCECDKYMRRKRQQFNLFFIS